MIYIGYQITPVPGKLNDVLNANKQLREIAEANGARQVGGFQVTLGPDSGSLVYIVAYPDADAYLAAGKALADSAATKQLEACTASQSSSALQPLPDSALQ